MLTVVARSTHNKDILARIDRMDSPDCIHKVIRILEDDALGCKTPTSLGNRETC